MSKPAEANASTNCPTASVTAPMAWVTVASIEPDTDSLKVSSAISEACVEVVDGSSFIPSLD
jgi:hypothetical protein